MADLAALNDSREFLSRCEAECKALVGFGRLANVLGLFRAAGIRYGAIVFDLPVAKVQFSNTAVPFTTGVLENEQFEK